MVKVILRDDVKGVGKAGDVKQVKDGFARNYLFPKKLALIATEQAVSQIAMAQKKKEALAAQALKKAQELAEKLKNVSVTVTVDVNEDEKMYGSLTAADIAQAIAAEGVTIDKKLIGLEHPIKDLGIYDVPIKIGSELSASVKVWVVKK